MKIVIRTVEMKDNYQQTHCVYVVEFKDGPVGKLKAFHHIEEAQRYIINWFTGFMEDLYDENRLREDESWECETLNDFQNTYSVKVNLYRTGECEPLEVNDLFWKAVDYYREWKAEK